MYRLRLHFPISNLQNGNVCAGSEKYDIEEDAWATVAAFPGGALSHRSQHASVRFQNVILVSGGLGGGLQDLVLDSVRISVNTIKLVDLGHFARAPFLVEFMAVCL